MYFLSAMQTLEIQMEVEKFDSEGNTIGFPEVTIQATYSKEEGDYLNPPYESMEIDSVTLEDGESYELSSYEERQAIIALYEELRAR
jgi:hypothetical protein